MMMNLNSDMKVKRRGDKMVCQDCQKKAGNRKDD